VVRHHEYEHNRDNQNKALKRRSATAARRSPILDQEDLGRSAQPKGRFALIRATSVLSTRAALLSRRLRFAFLADNKWRREECARNTLPRAVILKRLATALRVLLRAIGFGIRLQR
jgi:hypothetical protein